MALLAGNPLTIGDSAQSRVMQIDDVFVVRLIKPLYKQLSDQ